MREPPYLIIFYLVLLSGTAVLLREAYRIEGLGALSGPGTFPLVAAGVMAVCLLALTANAMTTGRGAQSGEERAEGLGERLSRIVTMPMIGYMLVCVIYVAALEYVGFWIASAAFLFVSFIALYRKGLPRALLATIIALAFVYVVFRYAFQVYLP